MNDYEYRPENTNAAAKAVFFILLAAALAVYICGGFIPAYRGAVQMAALVIAMAAIMFGARFVMTGYVYEITEGESGSGPDLVITEIRGKKRTVMCRVGIIGARLAKREKDTPRPKGTVYNYSPGFMPAGEYLFFPPERDAEGMAAVRFLPSQDMLEMMKRMGAEVPEDRNISR